MYRQVLATLILCFQLLCGAQSNSTRERSEIVINTSIAELPQHEVHDECGDLDLRYLVTSDRPVTDKVREVRIFLDPKAFSNENLRRLFGHISKKYREPDTLLIYVETDWERIVPPDACPSGDSSLPKDPKENDFHRAFFRRHGSSATFRFNPVLKTTNYETVKLEPGTF